MGETALVDGRSTFISLQHILADIVVYILEDIFWRTLARKRVRYCDIHKLVCLQNELNCHSAEPGTSLLLTILSSEQSLRVNQYNVIYL